MVLRGDGFVPRNDLLNTPFAAFTKLTCIKFNAFMKKPISFLLLIISLASCSTHNNADETKQNEPAADTAIKIITDLKGIYYLDDTVKKFASCDNPDITHIIKHSSRQLDSLYKFILPNAYPNEGIYVEMKAEILASPGKNFGDVLSIKSVTKAEQKNFKNTCIIYDYWCYGTEPFWQLQISAKENLIDFYDPMQQKTIHFNYSKPEIADGITAYDAADEKLQNKIRISVKKEKCSDGMSERQYNYAVEIMLNGKLFKGCAMVFNDKLAE